jgi:hypothetical protein
VRRALASVVGTNGTFSDVRSSVAIKGKADIARAVQFGRFDPTQTLPRL